MYVNQSFFLKKQQTLGGLAEKCAAYAKALHYKEIEFQTSPATTCEALISINNQLDLPQAAVGILVITQTIRVNCVNNVITGLCTKEP
jgi:phosphatidylinositol kinase/protein kinase (PI-3  family)